MAITLGTNIPSYTARVNLNSVTAQYEKTLERLSSGKKINSAGDDAAGLVISENMEALVRGSKQAQANIQNAQSFLSIAEDGMVSIGDHLQRINDLLVNMANDTNDVESRRASANEIVERIDEVNRLAESTNFNGRCMLDGSEKTIVVQMGPDETLSSVLDITPALTDCHVDALQVTLPGYLNPDARIDTANGDKIVVPVKETQDDGTVVVKYYYEGTDTEVQKADYDQLTEPAFNASNENCRKYMAKIQDAIAKLASCRGLIGAYENRIESSYDSMTTRIECLEAARSIYQDTDIAEEATNYSKRHYVKRK